MTKPSGDVAPVLQLSPNWQGWREQIRAVMFFPDDTAEAERRRQQYLAAISMGVAAGGDDPEQDVHVTNHLLRYAPYLESGPLFAGRLCGEVLFEILRLARAGGKPSLNQAFKEASGAIQPEVKRGASQHQIRNIWERFAPVAHYWAIEKQMHDSETREALKLWLAATESLREQGEGYCPLHSHKTPVLDPLRTWRAPANLRLPTMRWSETDNAITIRATE